MVKEDSMSLNYIKFYKPTNDSCRVRVPLPELGSETLVRTRILQSVESGITIHRFNDITARMKNRMEK